MSLSSRFYSPPLLHGSSFIFLCYLDGCIRIKCIFHGSRVIRVNKKRERSADGSSRWHWVTERGASKRRQCGGLAGDEAIMHFAVTKNVKLKVTATWYLGNTSRLMSGTEAFYHCRHTQPRPALRKIRKSLGFLIRKRLGCSMVFNGNTVTIKQFGGGKSTVNIFKNFLFCGSRIQLFPSEGFPNSLVYSL